MNRFFRSLFILRIIWQYGLDELVLSGFKSPWLDRLRKRVRFGRKLKEPRGVRLRCALEKLGPVFVKFGQLLSTRADLLPADIVSELTLLQDRVPPFDSKQAIQLIEKALKHPVSEIFVSFEQEPVASASIAQVYFATLRMPDGNVQEVAVKVLRPGMKAIINQDVALMRWLARCIERLFVDGRRLRPNDVVDEFDRTLHDELDLLREAANASQIRRNLQDLQLLLVPEMYWDYCTTNVIVMERMKGVPINQVEVLRNAGVDIPKLARDGVTIFFTQVFRDGIFHADMHPGNIQVSLEPQTLGRYIGLDFGIVGTLTEVDKDYLAQNFIAFFRRDYKRVAELHVESGWVPASTRVDQLEAAVRACCEPYFDRPLKDISLGMILMQLFQTSRRFNVQIQPQLVLLQKTMLNVEGLGRQLDPDLDLWCTARPFLENWMKDQVGFKVLLRKIQDEMPRYAQYFPAIPRLVYQVLENKAQDGQYSAHKKQMAQLIEEQRRTNKFLKVVIVFAILTVLVFLFLK